MNGWQVRRAINGSAYAYRDLGRGQVEYSPNFTTARECLAWIEERA